jgi:hypothetical protein
VRIAILGPEKSKWTKEYKAKARGEISQILIKYCKGYHHEEHSYNGFLGYKTKWDCPDVILVSGHCPKGGVDIWAEEIADELGIKKEMYAPEVNQWNDKYSDDEQEGVIEHHLGYRSRNIQIAEACDVLYNITRRCCMPTITEDYEWAWCKHCKDTGHISSGACWTMQYAKKLGKETHLVVIK